MQYDPDIHHRRSIRLKGWDYSSAGAYSVTICAKYRECLLGNITGSDMCLNEYGNIAADCWQDLPKHYAHIELDAFIIMPNHVHGIIVVGAGFKPAFFSNPDGKINAECKYRAGLKPAPTYAQHGLSEIVRAYKTFSTRYINKIRNASGIPVWQRNFYEHIIRNEQELDAIRTYIKDNPSKWTWDEENPNIKGTAN